MLVPAVSGEGPGVLQTPAGHNAGRVSVSRRLNSALCPARDNDIIPSTSGYTEMPLAIEDSKGQSAVEEVGTST